MPLNKTNYRDYIAGRKGISIPIIKDPKSEPVDELIDLVERYNQDQLVDDPGNPTAPVQLPPLKSSDIPFDNETSDPNEDNPTDPIPFNPGDPPVTTPVHPGKIGSGTGIDPDFPDNDRSNATGSEQSTVSVHDIRDIITEMVRTDLFLIGDILAVDRSLLYNLGFLWSSIPSALRLKSLDILRNRVYNL